jgi:hypothetical protein
LHSLTYRHVFRDVAGGTLMVDEFPYSSRLSVLGRVADRLFLGRYMRAFLVERARGLRQLAQAA